MIRALFLLFSLISFRAFSQTPVVYQGVGIRMKQMWADSVARIPSDTTINKTGIAVKGTTLYIGNGFFWTAVSGGGSFVGVDSVVVKSSGCVDTFYQWKQGVRTIITTVDEQNGINSGGAVTVGANDTTFNVAAAVYKIGCVRYSSNAATLVLNGNSDSAKGRIDVIGVNSSGAVFAIQGQNLTNPIAPSLSATQLGLATVYFPPLKDSGITNIYNNVNVNGIDSSAYISVATTPDSLCFIFTSRRRSDTICTTRGSGGGIDSLRRIGINVSALKNGVWTNQYTDSVGSGGGSQNLDQTLAIGNNTDSTINFVDTLSTGSGKIFTTIYPRGYNQSGYPNGRPAMFNGLGYGYYPGVNLDGRPNVVGLLWGYNGGFNNKVIAGEATWGVRTETWYQLGGIGHSEFHGVMPEFQPINGTASRRLATAYVNNLTGYTNYNLAIDNMSVFRGASDTVQLASSINRLAVGFKGVGDILLKNQDSATNTMTIGLALNGVLLSGEVSAGARPLHSFGFTSPINVSPGTSYGSSSTYTGLVNTTVAVANKYGFSAVSSGLTTQNWGGLSLDGNTTGTITSLYTRQLGANGTVETWLAGGNGSTAQYAMTDVGNGIKWRWYLKSGNTNREMYIGFGTSTYDSLMKFRGTDGKVQIRTNLNVGSTSYAVASAALEVTSTTQGFLPPRMTATQGSAITSPAEGLIIYVTNTNATFTAKGWWGWDGTAWLKLNN